MGRRIFLHEGWKLHWSDYACGPASHVAREINDSSWLDAVVPGEVHLDLMRTGRIPDPFVGTNCDDVLWMEHKDWWYRLAFTVPEKMANASATRILFHGLDCFATVYLNGEHVARHRNMFTPLEIDVTDQVEMDGPNVLVVRLASPLYAPFEYSSRAQPEWGFPRQLSRKAQMSYGWDIAPRLITTGIWRPVELLALESARILDPHVATVELAEDHQTACMKAIVPVEVLSETQDMSVVLKVEGRETARATVPEEPGSHEVVMEWTVSNPRLWWPCGAGEAHLYSYEILLLAKDEVLDGKNGNFGIRTVSLDSSEDKSGGHNFRFHINGRPLFMKGWNWTPPDALFARITPQRRAELLGLARDSGANMIRVWGGGIYEPPDFYDTCDRLGLLVYQDFMFACSSYPQDDEFLSEVTSEAEHVVKSIRSHPCIALWCGDNECDACYSSLKEAAGNRITRGVLPAVVSRLDPFTPYIPSSPWSPAGRLNNDPDDCEMHLWRHGESWRHDRFMKCRPRFVSEIGFLSLPSLETLEHMFGKNPVTWPPVGDVWLFHSSDVLRVGRFRGMQHLCGNIQNCGHSLPKSIEDAVALTQELQATAYREWVEHFSAKPGCDGILLWNLCDCWPQMSDAVIGWPLDIKQAYHAATEAFSSIDS